MTRFNIGLHWLEYTIHNKNTIKTIEELDNYYDNDLVKVTGSMYGYFNMYMGKSGSIILSDERLDHHHVILPGRWLTEIGEPALAHLGWIINNDGKLTRLDIACDDSTEEPNPSTLLKYCNDGQLVTRYRCRNSLENHKENSVTNYFGSMKSARFIRVYDKTKETKGNIKATRWEIVLRDEYAQQCALHILWSNLNKTFLSTLASLLDFRIPTSENRASRRKRMIWYQNFLGDIEKAQYTRYEPVLTLDRMEHWLQKQVSRTLATVLHYKHGDMTFIYDLIDKGKYKKLRL